MLGSSFTEIIYEVLHSLLHRQHSSLNDTLFISETLSRDKKLNTSNTWPYKKFHNYEEYRFHIHERLKTQQEDII